MEPNFFQSLHQKQVLSPQIRQYLRLLQLSSVELSQEIDQIVSENPMLEEEAPNNPDDLSTSSDGEGQETSDNAELEFNEKLDHLQELDENFRESYNNQFDEGAIQESQKKKSLQETLITKQETLGEHLEWQISLLPLSESEKKIASQIIGNLDKNGFLRYSVESLIIDLNTSKQSIKHVLKLIQSLDPPGVGATNLQEALLIQLETLHPEDSVAHEIVKSHMSLLEKRDWKKIAKELNISLEEVEMSAAVIAKLNPKPGKAFDQNEAIAITPDARVSFNEENNDEFVIEIFNERLPQLRINSHYRKLIRKKDTDEKTKEYLREKLQHALNFLKAIDMRKSTIRKITEELVKFQSDFLKQGYSALKPLRLKDIAKIIEMHESTVSRAIQGKYIMTPQGTIPYKSFFSSALETTSGDSESQMSMMQKIKRLIDNENPQKPLSDQAIVKKLNEEGIKIARRTVAKYRELQKILPSHMRKRK